MDNTYTWKAYNSPVLNLSDEERYIAFIRFKTDIDRDNEFNLVDFHGFADSIFYALGLLTYFQENGKFAPFVDWPQVKRLQKAMVDYVDKNSYYEFVYHAVSYLWGTQFNGKKKCIKFINEDFKRSPLMNITKPIDLLSKQRDIFGARPLSIFNSITPPKELNPDVLYKLAADNKLLVNPVFIKLADLMLKKVDNGTWFANADDIKQIRAGRESALNWARYTIQLITNGMGGWETAVMHALGLENTATSHLITETSEYERRDGNSWYAKADILYKNFPVECKVYATLANAKEGLAEKGHDADVCLCYIMSANTWYWGRKVGHKAYDFYAYDYTLGGLANAKKEVLDKTEAAIVYEMDALLHRSPEVVGFKVYDLIRDKDSGHVRFKENTNYKK